MGHPGGGLGARISAAYEHWRPYFAQLAAGKSISGLNFVGFARQKIGPKLDTWVILLYTSRLA